jgi:hypothetical protein
VREIKGSHGWPSSIWHCVVWQTFTNVSKGWISSFFYCGMISCMFPRLDLRSWKWRHYIPPKLLYSNIKLYSIASQKIMSLYKFPLPFVRNKTVGWEYPVCSWGYHSVLRFSCKVGIEAAVI